MSPPPVVFVPGLFGTELHTPSGVLWASLRCCYAGVPISDDPAVRVGPVLRALAVVPGVIDFDICAGFERVLLAAGYRAGDTFVPVAYDWRASLLACARVVYDTVTAVAARTRSRVDLVGFSTGGLAARAAATCDLSEPGAPRPAAPDRVRRLVCVGVPQRGTLDGALCAHRGEQMAPLGRRFEPDEVTAIGGAFDSMPAPGEPACVDARGRVTALDLYDPATWRARSMGIFAGVVPATYRFASPWRRGRPAPPDAALVQRFESALAAARAFHSAIASPPARAALAALDVTVVGSVGRPTARRFVLTDNGAVHDPARAPRDARAARAAAYATGDQLVDRDSLLALPRVHTVHLLTGVVHRRLLVQPETHRVVLAALRRAK